MITDSHLVCSEIALFFKNYSIVNETHHNCVMIIPFEQTCILYLYGFYVILYDFIPSNTIPLPKVGLDPEGEVEYGMGQDRFR